MTFALFALLLVGKLNAQFSGGTGTENNPYQITSREDLDKLNNFLENNSMWSVGKYFKLMNDITDSIRVPIGGGLSTFKGNFDGNNKKITLAINNYSRIIFIVMPINFYGLFSRVINAKIYNLTVDGYIRSNLGYSHFTGSIAGIADNSEIYNCVNLADIDVDGVCVGGIVGHLEESYISNCMNSGSIQSTYTPQSTVKNFCGGIVGHIENSSKIVNCINIGTIKAVEVVGGIVGGVSSSDFVDEATTILNCINSGFVSGDTQVGGIIGFFLSTSGEIKNCLNTGAVKGNEKVGCIVGGVPDFAFGSPTIENCYYDKQMCGGGE